MSHLNTQNYYKMFYVNHNVSNTVLESGQLDEVFFCISIFTLILHSYWIPQSHGAVTHANSVVEFNYAVTVFT